MTSPATPRVVIAGGGVAGLEAMLALRDLAGDRVRIEMHAPRREFVYRPFAVAAPFGLAKVLRFDLEDLAGRCGASFLADSVTTVDSKHRRLKTHGGSEVAYEALIVACGAKALWATPGAVTFWGDSHEPDVTEVVHALEERRYRKVIFTMPAGFGWPLPVYELALLSSWYLSARGVEDAQLMIVTPEEAPLRVFGVRASEQVASILSESGVEVLCGHHPVKVDGGRLHIAPGDPIEADAVISMPRLEGRRIGGLPVDSSGFIPIDHHGRIDGLEGHFAAGDASAFPVKQGGVAAQQADAVAEVIAHDAGAPVSPEPFDPVLRGLLLTGGDPRFVQGRLSGGHGDLSLLSEQALWWPPGKIAGHYIAPFLASITKDELQPPRPSSARELEVRLPADGEPEPGG